MLRRPLPCPKVGHAPYHLTCGTGPGRLRRHSPSAGACRADAGGSGSACFGQRMHGRQAGASPARYADHQIRSCADCRPPAAAWGSSRPTKAALFSSRPTSSALLTNAAEPTRGQALTHRHAHHFSPHHRSGFRACPPFLSRWQSGWGAGGTPASKCTKAALQSTVQCPVSPGRHFPFSGRGCRCLIFCSSPNLSQSLMESYK